MRHSFAQHAATTPRALIGRVRADIDTRTLIEQIRASVGAIRTNQDERFNDMQAQLDGAATTIAALKINGPGGASGAALTPPDPDYTRAFASYFRSGQGEDTLRVANSTGDRARIMAAMSEGSAPDGGFLAPVEWDRRIQQALVPLSPMRQLASIRTTSVGGYSTLWNGNTWGTGWVGESANRPNTTTTVLSSLTFPTGEIYTNPTATQRLLDDAQVDFPAWLSDQVSTEITKQEGIAFLAGVGVNQPMGFLQYTPGGVADATVANNLLAHPGGNLDVATLSLGGTGESPADALIDFQFGLAAPYRQNATWLMSSLTAAYMSKLKDGQGDYLWNRAIISGMPNTFLGRPVAIDEHMPPPSAGNYAMALGDFKSGYVINDRTGIRILRDPYTSKPYTSFYTTKRVGGGVLDPRAIRLLKFAA